MAKITLSSFLHLGQHYRGYLLRRERLFILVLDLELRLASDVDNSEGPVLHVALHILFVKVASNEPLGVEDGVGGVDGHLVLGGIANETLRVGESDVARGGSVTLVIRDNFNLEIWQLERSISRRVSYGY